MFFHRLNSLGSSFCSRGHPAFRQAGFRSNTASSFRPQLVPSPHPCLSVQGFPPWPPRPPHYHRPGHQIFASHPRNIRFSNISGGSWCSFHSSTGCMMEHRDREPPNKRKKSGDEKQSHRGGEPNETGGKVRDGQSKWKHHHQDFRTDGSLRPSDHFKDGSRDVSRENSRDKRVERTKTGTNDRQRKDSRDGTPKQPSQPAGSNTQIPKCRPETDRVSAHKPNAWFKGRGAEAQGGLRGNTAGQAEQPEDGGRWTGFPSQSPSTSHPANPWQSVGASRQTPPPATALPGKSLWRQWELCRTEAEPPDVSTAFDFSVMSYNILSQELLHDNAYLYRHCDPGILSWDYRLPNLLAEIQQHNADIVCLQEVQEDHYENQIKPALQALGYQCEFKKRTGGKPDGCALTFKTSRFSLLSSHPVEFFRRGDSLLDRDNVGLVVLLQPNNGVSQSDPSSFVCFANTHLLYNPRRGDIKLAQLAILLAEINRLSRLPDGSKSPVVLCGDFNSSPQSPLYSFLTTGCLEYGGLHISMVSGQESSPRSQRFLTPPLWSHRLGINHQCQYESKPRSEPPPTSPTAVEGAISNLTVEDLSTRADVYSTKIEHRLQLQSSYEHHLVPDGRPEITTCHSRTALTVDYILYSPDSTPPPGGRGLQLLGRLSLVGRSELEEVNGLPNQHHSSDHLPLLASFRLRR
ncbi:protein angel homolog 2 isoform X2 [Leuresthes tenuis]